eukprot:847296-Pelagomonas_calceolata.AAC.2
MYANYEYILVDGYKQARVRPHSGVKQGCPLSPLLFSLHINDVDCLAENVQGAITGTRDVRVTHMLGDNVPVFMLGGARLACADSFRYLGTTQ